MSDRQAHAEMLESVKQAQSQADYAHARRLRHRARRRAERRENAVFAIVLGVLLMALGVGLGLVR